MKTTRTSLLEFLSQGLSFLGLLIASLLLFSPSSGSGEDDFDKFAVYDDTNPATVNYDKLMLFMDAYGVEASDRLQLYYSAMQPEGLKFLEAYIKGLSGIKPTQLSRVEQKAYWLNLRCVLIINAIATEKPGRKMKHYRGDLENPGDMWTAKRVTIEGVSLSIHDIEKHILLRQFEDPNLVYGLYQGVKGGPSLPLRPLSGPTIDNDLRTMGMQFVNARSAVSVRSGALRVPLVFHWYKDTLFGGDDDAIMDHIASLAEPKLQRTLSKATRLGEQNQSTKFSFSIDEQQLRRGPVGSGGVYDNGGSDYGTGSTSLGGGYGS